MHFEKIINIVYSFGAAVVIFGAWGKLEHKDFGSAALTVGLLTEVAIFCVYGLMEWRKKGQAAGLEEADGILGQEAIARKQIRLEKEAITARESTAGREIMVWREGLAGTEIGVKAEVTELTNTMKQTNKILNKVFRTE